MSKSTILAQYAASEAVPVRLHRVDFLQAIDVAERHKLSIYDASYLWLARELRAELVTLDKGLAKAAAKP